MSEDMAGEGKLSLYARGRIFEIWGLTKKAVDCYKKAQDGSYCPREDSKMLIRKLKVDQDILRRLDELEPILEKERREREKQDMMRNYTQRLKKDQPILYNLG